PLRWLLIFVAILLALYLGFLLLLQSNFLSRYAANLAMDFVPELRLENVRGDIVNGLRVKLSYATDAIEIRANEANINLGTECVWQLALCIDAIAIDELIV